MTDLFYYILAYVMIAVWSLMYYLYTKDSLLFLHIFVKDLTAAIIAGVAWPLWLITWLIKNVQYKKKTKA